MSYEIEARFRFVNEARDIELFLKTCQQLNFNLNNSDLTFNDLIENYKKAREIKFWLNIKGADLSCSIYSNLISITFFNYSILNIHNVKLCNLLLQLARPLFITSFDINESKQNYSLILILGHEIIANSIRAYLDYGALGPEQIQFWFDFVKCLNDEYWECFINQSDETKLIGFELLDKLDEMDRDKPVSFYIEKDTYIIQCEVYSRQVTLTPYGEVKKKVINNHSQTDIEFYLNIILILGENFGLGEMYCTINK